MPQPEAAMAAGKCAQILESYLTEYPSAMVLEDGRLLFDMHFARYSITEQYGRCLLQFWSEERNLIRTVLDIQHRAQSLRLVTRRMGNPRPQMLEIVPSNDRRSPTARNIHRRNYQRLLERALTRNFTDYTVANMRSAMDLEHSFGPAYARGHLFKGSTAEAVIGVNEAEPTSILDGILTLGLLWLDHSRQHSKARRHFRGLKVIVPACKSQRTAERMAWLNQAIADFQLYTLDERSEELVPVDIRDIGNFDSRLINAQERDSVLERCRPGIGRILALLPAHAKERVEVRPNSATEAGLSLHGLEFARVRQSVAANAFTLQNKVTFGAGANETPLGENTEELCRELCLRLFQSRYPDGLHTDPLFRLHPERWLESEFRRNITELFPDLHSDSIYSQVPALSGSERGLLDLLTIDRNGRLIVLELKVNEDLHLPLQTLDYWIRVHALNQDRQFLAGSLRQLCAFERQGYFPGIEVAQRSPRMILAAPSLHIHPSNETVLRYLSPEINWELIGLSEQWRRELKVVFRKRSKEQ